MQDTPPNDRSRPGSESGDTTQLWIVFAALVLVLLLASLDQTIVATALPTIVGELGGLAHLSWVVTAYLLATTVVIPVYGKLGDVLGRKVVLQAAILIFLAGSALCGLSQTLAELIAFRAVQGLGGGGLIVTSMAIVGELVSPRERGRYQGIFGGVFGLSTVLGPLLGGFFTEHLSWRWIFYVNLPLGLLALFVIARVFHSRPRPRRTRIDYAGAVLLALALSSLVLVASLGGILIGVAPAGVLIMAAIGAGGLFAFIRVERRANDPLMPLALFGNRVFSVAAGVGFIVGLSLFGSTTLMPIYFQVVKGIEPVSAGLHLTPMMAGVLASSVTSGQIIARMGRYKPFPVAGTALMAFALLLLSRLEAQNSAMVASAYMLLLGLGLGMVMQVLILAVQNAVPYEELGVATSGATLFRSIGGTVGVALFGGIFAVALNANLAALHIPTAMLPHATEPTSIAALPDAVRNQYQHAVAAALQPVFRIAAVFALIGFFLTLALPELPLRVGAPVQGIAEAFAMPRDATSLEELERIVNRLAIRENRWRVYASLVAEAGLVLSPEEVWWIARLDEQGPADVAALAQRLRLDPRQVESFARRLVDRDLTRTGTDGRLELTEAGRAALARLHEARKVRLERLLAAWDPQQHADVRQLLDRLTRTLVLEPPLAPKS